MLLPLNIKFSKKKCLVIGSGSVALRKIRSLLECGGCVSVVSKKIDSKAKVLFKKKKIAFQERRFLISDLKDVFFVVCATNDRKINSMVSQECKKRKVLVNVVDSFDLSDVIFPAFFRQGSLVISVNTSGVSPALSKKIKQDLRKHFSKDYAYFLKELSLIRKKVQNEIASSGVRKKIFKDLTNIEVMRDNIKSYTRLQIKNKIKSFYDRYAHNYNRIKP